MLSIQTKVTSMEPWRDNKEKQMGNLNFIPCYQRTQKSDVNEWDLKHGALNLFPAWRWFHFKQNIITVRPPRTSSKSLVPCTQDEPLWIEIMLSRELDIGIPHCTHSVHKDFADQLVRLQNFKKPTINLLFIIGQTHDHQPRDDKQFSGASPFNHPLLSIVI